MALRTADAVIFDLFGTLIENLDLGEFEGMLSEMARVLLLPASAFISQWNNTWEKRVIGVFPTLEADIEHVCQVLQTEPDRGVVLRASEIRKAFARRVLKPREDALDMLAAFKESGCKTGLISNCAADLPSVWPGTAMARLVDVPVFSCSVGIRKPHPEIYRLACERLGSLPEKCVYVADGNEGELNGASQVGMRPVLFDGPDKDPYDEGRERREWRGTTISSLKDVLRVFRYTESGVQRS